MRKTISTVFPHVILYLNVAMGDDKWIIYNNVEWERSCGKWNEPPPTTPEPIFTQRRWCCVYGGIGRESSIISSFWKTKWLIPQVLLPIRPTKQCPEWVNRKRVIFHQDKARPHVSLMTRQKPLELVWEVLIHLPYSPDIALSDFHLC